jgi:hypothetical protein
VEFRKTARSIPGECVRTFVFAYHGIFILTLCWISFEELVTRYEEPDGRNRWDSPLFTVIYDDISVPQVDLWDAVVLRKPPPPNLSTVTVSDPTLPLCPTSDQNVNLLPTETGIRDELFIRIRQNDARYH